MVENQAYLFLVFSLTGIVIGILFDIFRVSRKVFHTSDIVTYIEDILFWVLSGFFILFNIWYFNNGKIRLYMFLGMIMGIIIYLLLISNFIMKLITIIFNFIKIIFYKILKTPISVIISILSKFFKMIEIFLNKFVKKGKNLINLKNKGGNLEKNGE